MTQNARADPGFYERGETKKSRGDCACCGTIHRPKASGCDALGVAGGGGGGLEGGGGFPPPELEKIEIRKTLDVIW